MYSEQHVWLTWSAAFLVPWLTLYALAPAHRATASTRPRWRCHLHSFRCSTSCRRGIRSTQGSWRWPQARRRPCCAVRTSSSTRRPAARTTGAAYGFCAGRPTATVCGVFRAGITARPWSNNCFIRGRILASSHDGAMSRAIMSIARARGAAVAELSSTLLHDEYVDEPEAAIMTEIIYLSYRRFQDLSCAMFS